MNNENMFQIEDIFQGDAGPEYNGIWGDNFCKDASIIIHSSRGERRRERKEDIRMLLQIFRKPIEAIIWGQWRSFQRAHRTGISPWHA